MANRTEYMREWRQKNRVENRKKFAAKARRLRAEKRAFMEERKRGKGCACGVTDPRVLDFHHPERRHPELDRRGWTNLSWDALRAEIELCEVLCKNCHWLRTLEAL